MKIIIAIVGTTLGTGLYLYTVHLTGGTIDVYTSLHGIWFERSWNTTVGIVVGFLASRRNK